MDEKITEAENLRRPESVKKYMELYQLDELQTREGVEIVIKAKQALAGCGVTGESLNIDVIFKTLGGQLIEVDSKEVTWDEDKRKTEAEIKARRDVEAKNRVLEEAKKKLHG